LNKGIIHTMLNPEPLDGKWTNVGSSEAFYIGRICIHHQHDSKMLGL
jgi:hypothetical protein